jgi:hypothetical protein
MQEDSFTRLESKNCLPPININDEQEAVSSSEEAGFMPAIIGRIFTEPHPVAEASLVAAKMLPVTRNRVRNRDQKIFG